MNVAISSGFWSQPVASALRPKSEKATGDPTDKLSPSRPTATLTAASKILLGDGPTSTVRLWQSNLGEEVRGLSVGPDGTLIANLTNGYLTLSTSDGAAGPRTEHELLQAPPIHNADRSTYLVGSWGVARIEPDGSESWKKYLGSSVFNPAVPTPDGGVIATPCSGAEVHRLAPDGETRWVTELEPKPCYGFNFQGPMRIDSKQRAVLHGDGRLYAVDIETGQCVLRKELAPESLFPGNAPAIAPDDHLAVTTSSTLQLLRPDGEVVFVWSGHSDRRIDQLPPEIVEKEHLDGNWAPMSCPPAFSRDGQVVYGGGCVNKADTHNLVALDRSGQSLWMRTVGEGLRVEDILVGQDSTIYAVGTSTEKTDQGFDYFAEVHALSPQGETLWTFRTRREGHYYNRVALDGNTLYMTAAGGTVFALRADALKEQCAQQPAGGQIDLGGGNFVVVGGVALRKRKSPPV